DVTFVNEMSILGTGQASASAWVTQVTGPTSPTYSCNSAGKANSSTHTVGSREYFVRIPGISALSVSPQVHSMPHVVAQSPLPSGVRCRILAYYAPTG